jgi:hypothetical protein
MINYYYYYYYNNVSLIFQFLTHIKVVTHAKELTTP